MSESVFKKTVVCKVVGNFTICKVAPYKPEPSPEPRGELTVEPVIDEIKSIPDPDVPKIRRYYSSKR
jgi:hypothetical protein